MSAEYLRQLGLVNQEKLGNLKIAIIGAGSIGSFTALALTKMGCKHLALWDNDSVELHNVSNQLFSRESIEMPKVVAVARECRRYTPTEIDIEAFNEFYQGQNLDKYDVVIALTDNIEGRKDAFEAVRSSKNPKLFIDGRMGGELFKAFAFEVADEKLCEKYYNDFIDGVANSEEPCTERTIIYNVLLASSIISSYVKKWVMQEMIPFSFTFAFKDFIQAKLVIDK